MSDAVIEIDLGRPVRLAEVPAIGLAFLRWWGGELLELMPAGVKTLLPQRKPPASIWAGATHWRIASDEGDTELSAALDGADLQAEINRILPGHSERSFTLLIPSAQVLIRRLQLPMLADARVRPAVELQIDRLTPFKSENARFGCRVVERRIEENDMTVEVAVAPRAPLDALEERLRAAAVNLTAIDVADENGGALGFDLRGAHERESKGYRLTNIALCLAAIFAWLMAYYALGAAGEAEIARWQARVAELRPRALHSAELGRQVQALSQPLEIAASRGGKTILDALKELTARVPDNAHLVELHLSGNTLEATGLAQDAPGLIAKLDASKLFADARFRAPVTRRPGTTQDRFELSLKIKGAGK